MESQNTQDQTYYLIDETPQIAEVKKQNNQYTVLNQWNFKIMNIVIKSHILMI